MIELIAAIILISLAVCVEVWTLMMLFNWVAGLFGIAFTLTFAQAFGVYLFLSLVGSFFQ